MPVSLPVSSGKIAALEARMAKLGIREAELVEAFIRSGGKGGQNVNKVSTAVRLSHKASGLDIKCNTHRTQGLNRYAARVMLCEKLEQRERDARAEENPTHKKKRLAKLDRKRKAKRKAAAKRTNKRPNTNWKDSGEW
ncbi:MAG: peptide chain release factor-like protein [Turneriella sp.]|nr:peptide chain release factor-like protein [Turneriella sp.]